MDTVSMNESSRGEQANSEQTVVAGGCFWGMERYLQGVDGVLSTTVGYAQSRTPGPSYEEVCSGTTDAVEAVQVEYDPTRVSLRTLTLLVLDVIDPFAVDRQGNDVGRQYRSGFYWPEGTQAQQEPVFRQALQELADREGRMPVAEVEALRNFYPAEQYHQDYLDKNPGGYCHISIAKMHNVARRQRYIESIWKLNREQYEVTQHAATEMPFRNAYDNTFEPGIYVDVVSGKPLFLSKDKFDSGCGWPAFSKTITPDVVTEHEDRTIPGRPRVEIRTADTQIHLGHVFDDGPADRGGLRYCMNSASLRFIPKSEMAEEGYGEYLSELD